jgi:hypothetical protein
MPLDGQIFRRHIAIPLIPELSRIQPVNPRGLAPRFVQEVLRSAWAIATLAIPQRDEGDLFAAKSSRFLQHPLIVALIGVLASRQRAKFAGHNVQRRLRFDREIPVVPISACEIYRVGKKGRLLERDIDFELHVSREARLSEEEIAAASASANCEIASGDTNVRKRSFDRSGGDGLLARRKPRRLSIWSVDHVAAEKRYGVRRSIGLYARHRDTFIIA